MHNTLAGRRSLVALLGLGLVVAGCGSSSSSSTSSTSSTAAAPALTKTEYVKQGNAICKAGNAARQAAFMAYAKAHHWNNPTPTKAQDIQLATAIAIPSIQATISAVKALVPPSSDQAQVTAMLAAAQQDLDRAKPDPLVLATSGRQFADSAKLLHAYGLTSCAKNAG